MRVLDVATGTGHLARAIGRHAARVSGVDITVPMLARAVRETRAAALTNIDFLCALAECLPFPNDMFNLVTCRFAFHHYALPRPCLREMTRVCEVGGTVAIVDLLAPDNPTLAVRADRIERLRDPSHTRMLTFERLHLLISQAGLRSLRFDCTDVAVDCRRWLALSRTPRATAARITALLRRELELPDAKPTGMRPFVAAGALCFTHRWVVATARKARSVRSSRKASITAQGLEWPPRKAGCVPPSRSSHDSPEPPSPNR